MASGLGLASGLVRGEGLVIRLADVARARLECGRKVVRVSFLKPQSRTLWQLQKEFQAPGVLSFQRRTLQRGALVEERAAAEGESVDTEETEEIGEREEAGGAESSQTLEKWQIRGEKAFNRLATDAVIKVLDLFYKDRDYARFYVLETIARVPYFAFVSVLHMYESFGWWRRADYIKVHFAESWNELHHLLTMEALGGDERWVDRFLAQHIAVGYYFMTVIMYLLSPRMAYHFSECVEKHAFHTYDEFLKLHGEDLKKLPAPEVAVKYYTEGDLYLFDEFQTGRIPNTRRPKVENLYDVFYNIREDEAEHCKTMLACQTRGKLRSPHSGVRAPVAEPSSSQSTVISVEEEERLLEILKDLPPAECAGIIECALTSSSFADRARKSGIEVK